MSQSDRIARKVCYGQYSRSLMDDRGCKTCAQHIGCIPDDVDLRAPVDYPIQKLAHDPVNHPSHYASGEIECIDAIRAALGLDGFLAYCRGNAIKYQWRADKKGATAEDLRKAAWYSTRAAEALERK